MKKSIVIIITVIITILVIGTFAIIMSYLSSSKVNDIVIGQAKEVPAVNELFSNQDKLITQQNRKIIKNATILLYTDKLEKSISEITNISNKFQGIIIRKEIDNNTKDKINGNLKIWIPSDKLIEYADAISKIGKLVNSNIFSEDITYEYFDFTTRLNNLKKQENRLLQLYDKKETVLKDVLELEKEIARVRTDIELIEGKIKLWDKQIEYSIVNISLTQDVELYSETKDILNPLRKTLRNIKNIFIYSFSLLIEVISFLIKAIIFVIPWLVGIIIIFIIWKFIIRKIIIFIKRYIK